MLDKKNQLLKDLEKEMLELNKHSKMVKGSVNKVCSKNAKGENKEIYQLTYKAKNNTTKTVYIKKNKLSETKLSIANYHKAKDILRKIISLNIELLKLD